MSAVRTIAHRGCAEQYPENTVHAIRRVAAHVDAVEVDVRRCASGELVVVHDATIDRVADRCGRVADLTYADLADCDVLDTGDGVPTLEAVFDAVPSDLALNVELKETGLADDVAALAGGHDHDVLVSSFLVDALHESRGVAPALDRALLFDDDRETPLDVAAEIECTAVHPSVARCLATPIVERAHERGFDVNAWTVRTVADAERLAERGVDGIIVDRRDLL
ncbi:glycerophosphodiester phosphodiesterase [Halarchaeum nitratireducens]|uniref:Glycerophosphoryl diester phosphodiesterase n=1 Tax=Halarchaeum nitratireducens TaxID=489913 RepID=A0A830GD11_9EURY|nr:MULTISPECIES: glycerophosphodiester phosphodiesterase family protein [Halarchaeum]MBP2251756.1 glycerophosphoryl diester phosphodiesterase [Halarchaeum solikamskense]GGN22500.1 glycerophosphoryl diester phosphodiesterase [Halarchaeum nitratireducens]